MCACRCQHRVLHTLPATVRCARLRANVSSSHRKCAHKTCPSAPSLSLSLYITCLQYNHTSCNPFLRCRDPAVVERVGCIRRTADYIVLQELLKLRSATSDYWWIHADRENWCHAKGHVRYHPFEIGRENERKPGCCTKACFLRRKDVQQPIVGFGEVKREVEMSTFPGKREE